MNEDVKTATISTLVLLGIAAVILSIVGIGIYIDNHMSVTVKIVYWTLIASSILWLIIYAGVKMENGETTSKTLDELDPFEEEYE